MLTKLEVGTLTPLVIKFPWLPTLATQSDDGQSPVRTVDNCRITGGLPSLRTIHLARGDFESTAGSTPHICRSIGLIPLLKRVEAGI